MRGHIRKRPPGFEAIAEIGCDPATGRRRQQSRKFPTEREAAAWLRYIAAHIEGGGGVPPSRLTVGTMLGQWLDAKMAAGVRDKTYANYECPVRVHLTPELGAIPLAKFRAADIDAYIARKRKQTPDGRLTVSVRGSVSVLGMALRWARRRQLITANPMDQVEIPRQARTPVDPRWGQEDIHLFLGAARRSSPFYVLYRTALGTGLRQAELLGLRWSDVDVLGRTITVQQVFYRIGKLQHFGPPKTQSSHRTIAIDHGLLDDLLALQTAQNMEKALCGTAYHDLDLVFCQKNGRPLHAHNVVRRDFHPLIDRQKLPKIRFHDLRHVFATYAIKAKVDVKDLQAILGHSSPRVTMETYAHPVPGSQVEAVRRVAALLGGHDDDAGR